MSSPIRNFSYWRRVLRNASAVKPGEPRYEEAQRMVALASRKIAFLNRSANQSEVETPDAVETARMAGLSSTAGDLASLPVQAVAAVTAQNPLLRESGILDRVDAFVRQLAGNAALGAKDVDPEAYARGAEEHPTANAIGEMAGPVVVALAGGLGRKSLSQALRRLKRPPASSSGLPNIDMELTPAGVPGLKPVNRPVAPYRDPLDVPTFLRSEAPIPETPGILSPVANIDRLLMLIRGAGRRKR